MNKILIVIVGCLIILSAVSLVVAYTYSGNTEQDYSEGALRPEPQKSIIRWSNPRYKDGTMINWEDKR